MESFIYLMIWRNCGKNWLGLYKGQRPQGQIHQNCVSFCLNDWKHSCNYWFNEFCQELTWPFYESQRPQGQIHKNCEFLSKLLKNIDVTIDLTNFWPDFLMKVKGHKANFAKSTLTFLLRIEKHLYVTQILREIKMLGLKI